MIDVLKWINLFDNTLKFNIIKLGIKACVLPSEIKSFKKKYLETYMLLIDNYSINSQEKIEIQADFPQEYEPKILNKKKEEIQYEKDGDILVIKNMLPKEKYYIYFYPTENAKEVDVNVLINGSTLEFKSKILNIFYYPFVKNFKLALLTFTLILMPIAFFIYLSSELFMMDALKKGQLSSQKEFIDQKMYEYYQSKGANPSLVNVDILQPPKGFYDQQKLKTFIEDNCKHFDVFGINQVKDYKELMTKQDIIICK